MSEREKGGERETDRQTDRQTDGQTDTQTDRHLLANLFHKKEIKENIFLKIIFFIFAS